MIGTSEMLTHQEKDDLRILYFSLCLVHQSGNKGSGK